MQESDFKLKDNELLPCPFCGGKLKMYIYDDTLSRFCNGNPCWRDGATCPQCGIGIATGTASWGVSLESIERHIIDSINRRPRN